MPKEGQVWPLQLVFLVLLVLAIVGFVAPNAVGPNSSLAWWLAFGALIAAIVLYVPVLYAWFKAGAAIKKLIGDTGTELAKRLAAIEARLGAIEAKIDQLPKAP